METGPYAQHTLVNIHADTWKVISKKAAQAEYIPKRECFLLVLGSPLLANVGGVRGQELETAFLIFCSSEQDQTPSPPAFAWAPALDKSV